MRSDWREVVPEKLEDAEQFARFLSRVLCDQLKLFTINIVLSQL
jgi:hypothetical protein